MELARRLLDALRARPVRAAAALAGGLALAALVGAALGPSYTTPVHDRRSARAPRRTRWADFSVAVRVRLLRSVGDFLSACVLPRAQPSAVELPGGARGAPAKMLVYLPPGVDSVEAAAAARLPVYVNAHGGGYIAGFAEDDDAFCALLARSAGVVVLSVAYALAPEAPPPAGARDVARAAQWAATALRAPRVALGGFSAGGCYALAAAAHLSGEEGSGAAAGASGARVDVALCVAFFPPVDLGYDSRATFAHKCPYGKELFYEAYLRDTPPSQLSSPLISPACAPPERFPRSVLILTGSLAEPNLPDIEAFARRLCEHAEAEAARAPPGARKREVRHVDFPHVPHGWPHLPAFVLSRLGAPRAAGGPGTGLDARDEAFALVVEAVRGALVGGAVPLLS